MTTSGREKLRLLEGAFNMFPLTLILSLAVGGALAAFTAVSTAALAYELVDNLGPVPPHEPILTSVGSKRVIAFYEPESGKCVVHLVLWDPADDRAESTKGYQATLNPRQMAHIDTPEYQSLHLQCSDNAERLAIVDPSKCIQFVVVAAPNW